MYSRHGSVGSVCDRCTAHSSDTRLGETAGIVLASVHGQGWFLGLAGWLWLALSLVAGIGVVACSGWN